VGALVLLLALMHPSAWKGISPKFCIRYPVSTACAARRGSDGSVVRVSGAIRTQLLWMASCLSVGRASVPAKGTRRVGRRRALWQLVWPSKMHEG
jgi:hypothetical protein